MDEAEREAVPPPGAADDDDGEEASITGHILKADWTAIAGAASDTTNNNESASPASPAVVAAKTEAKANPRSKDEGGPATSLEEQRSAGSSSTSLVHHIFKGDWAAIAARATGSSSGGATAGATPASTTQPPSTSRPTSTKDDGGPSEASTQGVSLAKTLPQSAGPAGAAGTKDKRSDPRVGAVHIATAAPSSKTKKAPDGAGRIHYTKEEAMATTGEDENAEIQFVPSAEEEKVEERPSEPPSPPPPTSAREILRHDVPRVVGGGFEEEGNTVISELTYPRQSDKSLGTKKGGAAAAAAVAAMDGVGGGAQSSGAGGRSNREGGTKSSTSINADTEQESKFWTWTKIKLVAFVVFVLAVVVLGVMVGISGFARSGGPPSSGTDSTSPPTSSPLLGTVEAVVPLELQEVEGLMASEDDIIFETACGTFLEGEFRTELGAEMLEEVKCEVDGQSLLALGGSRRQLQRGSAVVDRLRRRRRLAEAEASPQPRAVLEATRRRRQQAAAALRVDLRASGRFAPTEDQSDVPNSKAFGESVRKFFEDGSDRFLDQLGREAEQAGVSYFDDVTVITVVGGPTGEPTAAPTVAGEPPTTTEPEPKPELEPTAIPTVRPTLRPTAMPVMLPPTSVEPTATPTSPPAAVPPTTPEPSVVEPAPEPTDVTEVPPTSRPTVRSTMRPTATPTAAPVAPPGPEPTTSSPTTTPGPPVPWTFFIDCYHSSAPLRTTSDTVCAKFYTDLTAYDNTPNSCDDCLVAETCRDGVEFCGSINLHQRWEVEVDGKNDVKHVLVVTDGEDEFFIDRAYLKRGSDEVGRWGENNGEGWCLSTDPDDWREAQWGQFVGEEEGCHEEILFNV